MDNCRAKSICLSSNQGLILDLVRKANSGHSGGPMSSADFTQILFTEYLNFDPNDPEWLIEIVLYYQLAMNLL